MIKELTLKEVARKLADEGVFDGILRDSEDDEWTKDKITGFDFSAIFPVISENSGFKHCAIEIPDQEPEYEPYPYDGCPPLKCGDVIVKKVTE